MFEVFTQPSVPIEKVSVETTSTVLKEHNVKEKSTIGGHQSMLMAMQH